MSKISFRTILTTLIGTSIASTIMALPVRAEESRVNKPLSAELTLGQNSDFFSDRPNNGELSDEVKTIVGVTGLAIGTGVIGWHLTRAYKPSFVNAVPAVNRNQASLLDRVSPHLRRDLLRLVHNPQTANRLLSGTLISHPDRSPNWVAEKVIYDLRRDRT
ncbi:MAG: hypothetical protein ACFB4I_11785 [Cyanophyceae cyanobacterium]